MMNCLNIDKMFINYMQKKLSENILSLKNLKVTKKQNLLTVKTKLRDLQTSIPSLYEATKVDRYLGKLHKWRKEVKQNKLQQTYDQNLRIFISLKKQKSEYKLPKKMTSKQSSHSKITHLPPLTERQTNKPQHSYTSKLVSPRHLLTEMSDNELNI